MLRLQEQNAQPLAIHVLIVSHISRDIEMKSDSEMGRTCFERMSKPQWIMLRRESLLIARCQILAKGIIGK